MMFRVRDPPPGSASVKPSKSGEVHKANQQIFIHSYVSAGCGMKLCEQVFHCPNGNEESSTGSRACV